MAKINKRRAKLRKSSKSLRKYELGGNVYGLESDSQTNFDSANSTAQVVGKTGAVGSVIGSAWGMGNSIGQADLKKNLKFDDHGSIQNSKNAQKSLIRGSFFDPIGTGMRAMKDPDASTGEKVGSFLGFGAAFSKKRTKRIEDRAQEAARDEAEERNKTLMLGELEGTPNYQSTFKNGGTVKNPRKPKKAVNSRYKLKKGFHSDPRTGKIVPDTKYAGGGRVKDPVKGQKYNDAGYAVGTVAKKDRPSKFNSHTDLLNYYKDIGFGDPVVYSDNAKTASSLDSQGVVETERSDRSNFNKTANYMSTRGLASKEEWDRSQGKSGNASNEYARGGKVRKPVNRRGKIRRGFHADPMSGQIVPDTQEATTSNYNRPVNSRYKINKGFHADPNSGQIVESFEEDVDGQGLPVNSRYHINKGFRANPNSGQIEPQFAMGGSVPEVPVELEGGESGVTPQGEDFNVAGPSHAEGGVPMELPEETAVYSDRLKKKGTGKTYSELNKQITNRTNKYEKTLEDPESTGISKRTAERMLSKYEGQQHDLFMDQERLKQVKGGFQSKNKFALGGTVGSEDVNRSDIEAIINESIDNLYNKYDEIGGYNTADGKHTDYKTMLEEKRSRMLTKLDDVDTPERLNKLYHTITHMQGYSGGNQNVDVEESFNTVGDYNEEEPSLKLEPWMTDAESFQSQPDQGYDEYEDLDFNQSEPNYQDNIDAADNETERFSNLSSGGSKFGSIASALGQAAPALYNMGKGLFGDVDEQNAGDYRNIGGYQAAADMRSMRYDVSPELRANRRATAMGKVNVRNASRSRGELLGNYGALSSQRSRADSSVMSQAQNMRNQYRMQGDQLLANIGGQYATTKRSVDDYNARARTAKENYLSKGMSQLSGVAQQYQKNQNSKAVDAQKIAALKKMFPNQNFNF